MHKFLIRIKIFGMYAEYPLNVCHEGETAMTIKSKARDGFENNHF